MNITLRQATTADYDFLYDLHRQAMRPYVDATWGWVEAWQEEYFRKKFDPAPRQIIQVAGQDIGVLVYEDKPDHRYLALLELLPAYQGRGIGTAVVKDLLQWADDHQMRLLLHVLKTNPRARQLYQRLGFVICGEEEIRWQMEYVP